MTIKSLIWKELRERPISVTTCLLAISLGVAALVAIRSVTVFSESAVSKQLENLGANVLLLPSDSTLQDYYSADLTGKTLPEEHAMRLALAALEGVEAISPRLSVATDLGGRKLTLTGILPQSEFQTAVSWQSAGMFNNKHSGCKRKAIGPAANRDAAESLARGRLVQELEPNELLVGADVAQIGNIKAGDEITLLKEAFTVKAIVPATGTVNDGRVFAHLHTVQRIAGTGPVVNAIELTACCEDAAGGLIGRLKETIPDAKVVTVEHVVQAQVAVNRLMAKISYVFFGVLVVVSLVSIAGTMFANVRERRREIGTLMALGATQAWVSQLFLGKAVLIGVGGGVLGYALGTLVAIVCGPQLVGVAVQPLPSLAAVAIILAGGVSLLASYVPARRAALIDPCLCFREV